MEIPNGDLLHRAPGALHPTEITYYNDSKGASRMWVQTGMDYKVHIEWRRENADDTDKIDIHHRSMLRDLNLKSCVGGG